MRAFFAKIFKPRTPRATAPKEEDAVADKAETRAEKPRKMWRFKIPRRCRTHQVTHSLEGNVENLDICASAPERMLWSSASARSKRRPNMASTQRKLAASQRRIRHFHTLSILGNRQRNHTRSISRSQTFPTMKNSNDPSNRQGYAEKSTRELKRARNFSSFRMHNARGSRIEVEFTDDGESVLGEDLYMSFKRTPHHPVAYLTATPEHHPRLDTETPCRLQSALSMHSTLSTAREESRLGDCATEWESVAESSDEAAEAWAEFHREQMLAKLAGLQVQMAPESQVYRAKRAMRIQSPLPAQPKSRIPRYTRPVSIARPVSAPTSRQSSGSYSRPASASLSRHSSYSYSRQSSDSRQSSGSTRPASVSLSRRSSGSTSRQSSGSTSRQSSGATSRHSSGSYTRPTSVASNRSASVSSMRQASVSSLRTASVSSSRAASVSLTKPMSARCSKPDSVPLTRPASVTCARPSRMDSAMERRLSCY